MNRAAAIMMMMVLLMLCCSHLTGQKIIIQSNNMADYELMEKEVLKKLGPLPDRLKTVLSNNPDYSNGSVIIQITYFDPYTIGNMKLKSPHVHTADYVQTWKNAYPEEDRILFLFEKQATGNYSFKDFAVTPQLSSDGQLPDIVTDYIKTQILEKEQNDLLNLVYKGINAVKNAFDRRFMKRMIEDAPERLKCRYYYKGYAFISTNSYYFKSDAQERKSDMQEYVTYLIQGKYYRAPLKTRHPIQGDKYSIDR
jgi:hypothetical protein